MKSLGVALGQNLLSLEDTTIATRRAEDGAVSLGILESHMDHWLDAQPAH